MDDYELEQRLLGDRNERKHCPMCLGHPVYNVTELGVQIMPAYLSNELRVRYDVVHDDVRRYYRFACNSCGGVGTFLEWSIRNNWATRSPPGFNEIALVKELRELLDSYIIKEEVSDG